MASTLLDADPLGRFEAVQTVHLYVEEDYGKIILPQTGESQLARTYFHEVWTKVFENGSKRKQVSRVVIHQQDVGPRSGRNLHTSVIDFRQFRHLPPS